MVCGFNKVEAQLSMSNTVSLSRYVKKRNGVALGAAGSMSNMLKRSVGAGSFYLFWRYWNPIWGYYLARYIMKPLSKLIPISLATFITFSVSGGLHDLAVSLVKWRFTFFFTPWFALMSLAVLAVKEYDISYYGLHWGIRGLLNLSFVGTTLALTLVLL